MSYQIISLIVISAVVIYFSIAGLVWKFRNRHFRRRMIIGVLIAALLISHIDFINLFTRTDAETVLAAAADADIDISTEDVDESIIEKLSDGVKRHAASVGTALDGIMQPETWKIFQTSADMDTMSIEETEVDGNLLDEAISDITEGEILTETEEGIEEEDSTELESDTEEENSTEPESDTEEGNSTEPEKDTEEEVPTEHEGSEEGSLNEDSTENFEESEESSDEADSATDAKTIKEAETQEDAAYEDGNMMLSAGGVILMANMDDHDSITDWIPWDQDDSLPSSTGNYYLTKDMNLPSPYSWSVEGEINICWNGKNHPTEFSFTSGDDFTLNIHTYNCNGSHDTYSITYNGGSYGEGEVKPQTKKKGETITLSRETFTRIGYKQIGWATQKDGDMVYDLGGTYKEDRDITLYPAWKANTYTITYVKNGGTIDKENDYIEYTYGVGLELPTPSKEGYIFEGWYEDSKFSGAKVTEIAADATGNKIFYAKWVEDFSSYTITYVKNGGTIANESNYKKYTPGEVLKLPIPTKEGYIFEGWYEDSKFSGAEVTEITADATGNKTFYAKWSIRTYEITYICEPYDTIAPQIKPHGKSIKLSNVTLTRDGYKHIGWSRSEDGTKDYELGGSYKENETITLYPAWARTYTITYEPYEPGMDVDENIEGSIGSQTKTEKIVIKLSSKTFTRKGYKQTGWEADVNGEKVFYKLGQSYTNDEDITLYPVWAIAYKVTYNKNGGTIENESNYTSYAYGVGLTLPKPTRPGYKFMGWYKDQNFKGSAISGISATDKEDKTFYAKWEEIISEDNGDNEDSYDGGDDGDSSSDSGDTGSGNTGNTQPGTNEKTESEDTDDTDETDEDPEDDDTDNSKDKRKRKEKADDDTDDIDDIGDIDDASDIDDSDEEIESDADDDMESSEESKKSIGEAGIKSVNRSVQAGLENGEIVISGNSAGPDRSGAGGNGAGGETSGEESANASIGTVTIPGEESAATVLIVGEGSVIVTVVSDEWKYGAGVADTVTVANTVLTSEQKQLVNSGENIEIRLVVKDISGQVSEEDRSIIEKGLKADKDEGAEKLVPAAYIDISMNIRTGDGDWKAVTRTDKPIKVVVGISEEWSDDKAFYIARSHESEYALLEDLDSETDTVTIMTELFSTYAIVYRQTPVIVKDTDRISDFVASHSWITVAGIGAILLCIGILDILGIIAIMLLWKLYKKEREDEKRDIVTS